MPLSHENYRTYTSATKNTYSLVGQVCIKFGAVGPVFIYKTVDSTYHTMKFLKILDLNFMVLSSNDVHVIDKKMTDYTNFKKNLTFFADCKLQYS